MVDWRNKQREVERAEKKRKLVMQKKRTEKKQITINKQKQEVIKDSP
jgi:ATP-dependent 26S proteasome regulatory subunit